MLHCRSAVVALLLAFSATTVAVPVEAWAKKGKRGAKDKAGKAAKKAAKKAARRAKRMEKVGKVAYKKGKFGDALIAFAAAYKADPQPKFLYNIARCHEKSGDLAKAAEHYERYLREAPDAEDREEVETQAEFLTQKLQATMGRLEIVSEPPGAVVQVEGKGRSENVKTPWTGWLEPGVHELKAMLEGHEDEARRVALTAGDEKKVELEMKPVGGAEPEPEPKKPAAPAEPPQDAKPEAAPAPEVAKAKEPEPAAGGGADPESGGAGGIWGWVGLGVGAAGLAGGVVFGLMADSATEEEEKTKKAAAADPDTNYRSQIDSHHADAQRNALLANVAYGVGAVALVAGGLAFLLGGDGEAAAAGCRPGVGPGRLGLSCTFP